MVIWRAPGLYTTDVMTGPTVLMTRGLAAVVSDTSGVEPPPPPSTDWTLI